MAGGATAAADSGGGAAEAAAGAEGVEVGGQGEVEVEGEGGAQLQRVQLEQRNAPDLRPVSQPVSCENRGGHARKSEW